MLCRCTLGWWFLVWFQICAGVKRDILSRHYDVGRTALSFAFVLLLGSPTHNSLVNIPPNLKEIATKDFMLVSYIKSWTILSYGKFSKMTQKGGSRQKNVKYSVRLSDTLVIHV